MIADSEQKVVALDWAYSNADGTLSNQHVLQKPYGTTPFADVTEELAIGWLTEQLVNTEAEFSAALAKRKAEAEYEQTLAPYEPHPDGPPTPVAMPIADDEIEEIVPAPTLTKKK